MITGTYIFLFRAAVFALTYFFCKFILHFLKFFPGYFTFRISSFKNMHWGFPASFPASPAGKHIHNLDDSQYNQYQEDNDEQPTKLHSVFNNA